MSVLSLALAVALSSATIVSDSAYTPRQVAAELPQLVVVDSSKYGYSIEVDTVGAKGALGALAQANRHFVLYLTLNAPSAPMEALAGGGSRSAVKERVLQRLAADTMYLRVLAQSVERHRAVTKGSVAAPPTANVGVTRVQDIAARFFFPDAILENGQIQSHICVGINGIVDMRGGRDLAVEAFAYAAIFHDLLSPRFFVKADFEEASRLLNAMDLSTDPEKRLQRAQGVMWAMMVRSEKLQQVLAAEYQRAHTYLPFQVSGMPVSRSEAARR